MRPPIPIQTQRAVSALVLEACRTVVANPEPVHVTVCLESYSQAEDCHRNTAEKVLRDGGQRQSGWVIWELPDWAIQLEFHSVWRSPQGYLADVTPPLHKGPVVLFLPDPDRVYQGCNIPTVHYPYTTSLLCREYVEVADLYNRLIFPPGMPGKSRFVPPGPMEELLARLREIYQRAQQS